MKKSIAVGLSLGIGLFVGYFFGFSEREKGSGSASHATGQRSENPKKTSPHDSKARHGLMNNHLTPKKEVEKKLPSEKGARDQMAALEDSQSRPGLRERSEEFRPNLSEPDPSQVRSVQDVHWFLDTAQINKFEKKLGLLQSNISDEQWNLIRGHYTGYIVFDDGSPQVQVEWEVSGSLENQKIQGQEVITMARNGTVFSRTDGSGGIKSFTTLNQDSQAVFVELNHDSYVQLFHIPSLNQFIGNVYLRNSPNQLTRSGSIFLNRKP